LASGYPIFLHADTPDPTTLIYPLKTCIHSKESDEKG